MATGADRACFARSGQAVAGWGNVGSSGSSRRRRTWVQAQECTLGRGERDIGEVILWLEERVQSQENIEEQKRLQKEQREVVVDGVTVEDATSAVERPVRVDNPSGTAKNS